MKKFNKKWLVWVILGLLLVLLVVILKVKKTATGEGDFKLAILATDGVALVSISPERKMINTLKLKDDAKLWIPGGLGWYRNVVIRGLLKQEKKMDEADDLFFYNFGFRADKILVLNKIDDWKNKYWFRYRLNSPKMLLKEEIISGDINKEENLLDEVMVRDFSETNLVKEDLKLSIFNLTNINGLANFMARRFEWLGFSVVSTESLIGMEVDSCLIKYGSEVDKSLGWKTINKIVNCKQEYDENLNKGEIEFYFSDNFSSMIKYPSYNNM
ncbi:MAG: hypothetical protein PHX34_01820 [Candidatus Shapirobacteria bacterium]|nr:hypothetical protein [Candidatus Shapirobacteria bacterium]